MAPSIGNSFTTEAGVRVSGWLGTKFFSYDYCQGLVITILDVDAAPKQHAEVNQRGAGTTFSNSQKTKFVLLLMMALEN
jgi:hypothetical protein